MMTKNEAIVKNEQQGGPAMGPVTRAYQTVQYTPCSRKFYEHAAMGLLKAKIKVTCEQDVEKLKKLRGQGWQYQHRGTYFGSKAYEGLMTNCFDVDMLFDHWKKDKIEPWLPSGRGLSKNCIKYVSRMPIDIDDGPNGYIPTDVQCEIMDAAIADGVWLSDVGTTGDDRPAPLSPFDHATCQKGKGLHAGINFQPSTDMALYAATAHAYIAYFDSDTACADEGRRMRCMGLIAKKAGKEARPWRIHTWLYQNETLPTLQEVHDSIIAACSRKGITDPEADFAALKFCVTFKGVITKLTRRAKTAAEMVLTDAARADYHTKRSAELAALADRAAVLVREVRISRRLTEEAVQMNSVYNKMDADYDPRPIRTVKPKTTNAPSFVDGKLVNVVIEHAYNPEAVYAGADQEPWDFDNTIWLIRQNGTVHEGTALELFKAFGNKSRGIVSNMLCPYCGKDQRPEEAKPSGMISMHSDMQGATAKCHSCGALVKSLRGKKKTPKVTYVPALERLMNATTWSHQTDITGSKHVPDSLALESKVVLMSLPQGMGKSEFVVRRAAANPERSMLVVVPTQNLSDSAYGRLPGFELYSEARGEDGKITARRLVCCLDSLPRIHPSVCFDDVIVEEAHSTLRRFNDSKMRNRDVVWDTLRYLSQASEHFIFMDGCLTDVDVLAAKTLSESDDIQLVYARVKRNVTIVVHDKFVDAEKWRVVAEKVGPMFVYSNTKSDAMTIESLSTAPTKLVVSSDTTGEDAVIALMRDPGKEVRKYHTLIGTPSMGSGIDISVKHFNTNLCVAQSGTFTDPEAVVQGIWRDRVCDVKHLWVSDREVGAHEDVRYWDTLLGQSSDEEINRALKESRSAVLIFPRSFECTLNGMNKVRAAMHAEQAVGQNNLREHVYGMLKDQGVKLVPAKTMSKQAAKKEQKLYSDQKKAMNDVRYSAIANSDIITIEEARKLDKKRRTTKVERQQSHRAKVVDLVGDFPVSKELIKEYDTGELRSRVYRYAAVRTILEGNGETYAGARLHAYSEDRTRAENHSVVEAFTLAELLKTHYGVDASFLGRTINTLSSNASETHLNRRPRTVIAIRDQVGVPVQNLSASPVKVNLKAFREWDSISKNTRTSLTIRQVSKETAEKLGSLLTSGDRMTRELLRKDVVDHPMMQLRTMLQSIGITSSCVIRQENNAKFFDLNVSLESITRMSRMTAKARADLLPIVDTFEVMTIRQDEWPDDSEYEAAASF